MVFFDYVPDVASGKQTGSEEDGYREITTFEDGIAP